MACLSRPGVGRGVAALGRTACRKAVTLKSCCRCVHLQAEGSEAKKELAPEYVENQKTVDTALLGSLSDDLKVGSAVRLGTHCLVGSSLSRLIAACGKGITVLWQTWVVVRLGSSVRLGTCPIGELLHRGSA